MDVSATKGVKVKADTSKSSHLCQISLVEKENISGKCLFVEIC